MKFDAFYFERVCRELSQKSYHPGLMYKFIEKLEDGDTVGFVGCGLQPNSVLALEKLCDKDIKIIGMDPVLQKTGKYSEKVELIPDTLERVLGIRILQEFGSHQNMAIHAVNHGARVIAMYVCTCEDSYDSKSLVFDEPLNAKNHIEDVRLYLTNNGYSITKIEDNHFAILAEKPTESKNVEKPKGMSNELYEHLKKRGYFD